MSPVSFRGDPANLTWALFDYPLSVHAIPGKFTAGVLPDWPDGHIRDRACPCRPQMFWNSDVAPRPLVQHNELRRT